MADCLQASGDDEHIYHRQGFALYSGCGQLDAEAVGPRLPRDRWDKSLAKVALLPRVTQKLWQIKASTTLDVGPRGNLLDIRQQRMTEMWRQCYWKLPSTQSDDR